jgi:hypothetical protein
MRARASIPQVPPPPHQALLSWCMCHYPRLGGGRWERVVLLSVDQVCSGQQGRSKMLGPRHLRPPGRFVSRRGAMHMFRCVQSLGQPRLTWPGARLRVNGVKWGDEEREREDVQRELLKSFPSFIRLESSRHPLYSSFIRVLTSIRLKRSVTTGLLYAYH